MAITVMSTSDLPRDVVSRDFIGDRFGVNACVLFVDAQPGQGPRLHRHPYVEILILLEGTSTFDDGINKRVVSAGEMAVVEAGQAHGFVNTGDGVLRQIDIHLSPKFATEWLA